MEARYSHTLMLLGVWVSFLGIAHRQGVGLMSEEKWYRATISS